jgi:excisionase family DNA binding protein
MENKSKNEFITVLELAKILKISRVAVFKRIKKGEILAQKIGRNYAIPKDYATSYVGGIIDGVKTKKKLTTEQKTTIDSAVDRVIKDYGETLRLLGKE